MPSPPLRAAVYIDGFNLYYGMRADGLKRYYWLDMAALAGRLVRGGQSLVATKYFTARIDGPQPDDPPERRDAAEGKRLRQVRYLEALTARGGTDVFEGQYLRKRRRCFSCGATWAQPEEKMTDVNIATQMLVDAFTDWADVLIVVSADSDLTPPILAVRAHFPRKRLVVAMPPRRGSKRLRQATHGYLAVGRDLLRDSQLPDVVTTAAGHPLRRPDSWR